MRGWQGIGWLHVWWCLALQAPSSASASELEERQALSAPRCGFLAATAELESSSRGVPLVFKPLALSEDARDSIATHRRHLLRKEHGRAQPCPVAQAYVTKVLERLVAGSGLEAFAAAEPRLTIVLQCDGRVSLPVARASAGKVILVPRALPLLAESEDALAAVLAHELAHLTLRHAERFLQAQGARAEVATTARTLKLAHEREADVTGLVILANAGYDARAAIAHLRAVDALAKVRRPARRADAGPQHDDADKRAGLLEEQIASCSHPTRARRPVAVAIRLELEADPRLEPREVHHAKLRRESGAAEGVLVGPGLSRVEAGLSFGAPSSWRRPGCCILRAPP